MKQFSFDPVFQSWAFAIACGLVMLVVAVAVGSGSAALPWRRRAGLVGLRLFGLLLLLAALLRPTVVRTDQQPVPAAVAILMDDSRSMTLSDGAASTRWQAQQDVWKTLEPAVDSLGRTLEVRVLRYAGDSSLLQREQIDAWLQSEPEGSSTDVAAVLEQTLRGTGGRTLAAVVLMGDGTQTVTPAGAPAAASARTLASLGVPLWTVPIGPASSGEGRDVEVDDVPDEISGFAKNRLAVTATVRARGLATIPVRVQVMLLEDDKPPVSLAERTVSPQSAFDALPVEIEFTAPPPGSYRLSVVADQQQGERYTDNNSQTAFLDIREGGGRVLYIEGQPRTEAIFLRRAIGESQDLQLLFRWLEPGADGGYSPLPLDDLLTQEAVDVIVLGDLPATALTPDQLTQIAELVDGGKGLLMMGGYSTLGAGGWGQTLLADVLPTRLPDRPPIPAGSTADRYQLAEDIQLVPTVPHPVTTLSEEVASEALWRRLPPLPGMTLVPPPKPVPGVQVLLETARDPKPVLVVGEYGQGRTAVFGADSTWRWWRQGREDIHRRFWRQLMLWLLGRDDRPPGEIWIDLDRRRFAADTTTTFRAGATAGEAVSRETELIVEVVTEQDEQIPVPAIAAGQSETPQIAGSLRDLPTGLHRLRVRDSAGKLEPAELMFQVISADRELARPEADYSQMVQLAALTASAGGRAFPPAEAELLAEEIRKLNERAVVPVVEKYRLGDDPVTGWILLVLLVGALSTEWALRRRWSLP